MRFGLSGAALAGPTRDDVCLMRLNAPVLSSADWVVGHATLQPWSMP